MLKLTVDTAGVLSRLDRLHGAVSDLTPVWPQVENIFGEFIQKHFETEGGYTGATWAPLNPSYAEWKARHYGSKGMLHMTERLYGSLRYQGGVDHVHFEGPNFLEIGTRVEYAKAHHFGRPEINLPARKVIPGFTKEEGKRIVDAILAFLFKSMRRR